MVQSIRRPGLDDEQLLLAVANTAHGQEDELADAASVQAWWRGLGASATGPDAGPEADDSVAMLRSLRVLIRGLALRNNGIEPDLSAVAGLEALTLRLDVADVLTLRAGQPGGLARDIAAATVAALLRATARPDWPRVKACRGDDCRWVFVDGSRNCSRRWCAMANCGNRAKMATFRSRHRTTG
ncbi:CGNR zinc finger domain-containing protein [Actinoplanes sp. CA-030573]|uniref:CGNR zinc finger domain-containing protein n=1 Tax=Actinoplanes sp. CA-030573 TaxID=3239898 RepID=UPI003D90C44B